MYCIYYVPYHICFFFLFSTHYKVGTIASILEIRHGLWQITNLYQLVWVVSRI